MHQTNIIELAVVKAYCWVVSRGPCLGQKAAFEHTAKAEADQLAITFCDCMRGNTTR